VSSAGEKKMQLKTILNAVEKHPLFVYERCRLVGEGLRKRIEIDVRNRKGSQAVCSGCKKPAPGYDRLDERRFQFVPLWGIAVFFLYALRRVSCAECGIVVEEVPWALGKRPLTKSFAHFLASWAKYLSWKETAVRFDTSWEAVYRSVTYIVEWGRARMDLSGITAIGVDEIHWKKGKFMTLVYQINDGAKRLLWAGEDRKEASFHQFFDWLGEERCALIAFVCSDMWKPYLKVIAERATQALNILDRFHIAAHMNKALDEVRAAETKSLKKNGKNVVLKHSRWCLLKRPKNLTDKQGIKLKSLLQCNLRTIRAYLLKEEFQFLWTYVYSGSAEKFLDQWCRTAMRSRIEPMKKIARMLRSHQNLILNWFEAKGRISMGAVEGMNNKLKASIRKSYGFRTAAALKIMLYHKLGQLPEPPVTHRFC
jgi:transposase